MNKPGTYGAMNRDDYPTIAEIYVPFGNSGKCLAVPAFRFRDGSVSRAMFTEEEWAALPDEARAKLRVPDEYLTAPNTGVASFELSREG